MPNGLYPIPKLNPVSPTLRMRVRLHRFDLDDQLAHGADPASSPELELRGAQLLHDRVKLAAALERAVDSARRPAVLTAQVPLRREEVRECAGDLVALTQRLRKDGSIDVHGVARVSRLLHDGGGPLYVDGGVSLRYALRSARLALDPLGDAVQDVAAAA